MPRSLAGTKFDRSSTPVLRDRRAGGGGVMSKLCAPCIWFSHFFRGLSAADKIMFLVTVVLLFANASIITKKGSSEGEVEGGSSEASNEPPLSVVKGAVQGHLRKAKDKWDKLFIPSTPAPTMAPTEARIEETPEEIATKVAEFDWGVPKFEKPAECSADVIQKVKDSGMDGSGCIGSPHTQQCSITKLTKGIGPNTWVEGFMEEIIELRKGGRGGGAQNATFVAMLFSGYDCGKVATYLHFPAETPDQLTTWPWLWCTNAYDNDETKKWGKVGEFFTASTIDEKMQSRDLREAIKDAALAGDSTDSPNMVTKGLKTMARTRYIEFQYDWKEAWGYAANLKSVVDSLDAVGHTCYFAGGGKLWRLTACWQSFYGFKTWGHVACAHRVLAPKLAKRMEGVFKYTIGMHYTESVA